MEVDLADVLISHIDFLQANTSSTGVKVNVETRMVVDFQDPHLEISIDQKVEAEYLKRLTDHFCVVREGSDLVLDQRAVYLHCFCAGVGDAFFDLVNVYTVGGEGLKEGRKRPLGPVVLDKDVPGCRMHIVLVSPVDRVVCQVHEGFFKVGLGGGLVACLKSSM